MMDAFLNFAQRLSELPRRAKQAIVASIDVVMLVVATWTAYSLRMDEWSLTSPAIQIMLLASIILAPPTFYAAGVYRTIFRFAGVGMLATLARAFIVYGALTFIVFTLIGVKGVPRTLGVLQPITFFILVGGVRISIRFIIIDVLRRGRFDGASRRTMIYGAGIAGQQLANALKIEPNTKLVGFTDDDPRLAGQRLDGLTVYSKGNLAETVARLEIEDILLAIPSVGRSRRRQVVRELAGLGVKVKTLPPARHIIDGQVSVDDIRPLQIGDLLGRDPVAPDQKLLTRTVLEKTVMVTGAGGSIGSELCRQICQIGATKLLLFEMSEFSLYAIERELKLSSAAKTCEIVPLLGSVRDTEKLADTFRDHRVDTVFHAAAYKHVPLVEANPLEGLRNNIVGTHHIATVAEEAGVSDFILISTDKAVRPTNVMGASKRVAEQVVQAAAHRSRGTRFSMVRFGNVLGSSGSVVPLFDKQIRAGGPITVTHQDVTRYFMTIPEAANLVIQAGGMAKGGEVFVLDMGKPVRIADLARTMIQLSGLTVRSEKNPDGDIEIREVGLRPGEKLYEELLIGNAPSKTRHSRIMMASEHFLAWDEMRPLLEDLKICRDPAEAFVMLQTLVPEFEHCRDNEG
ncbi:polysaccharide biosynthesis protein [Aurantiacibacter aquimixticola]|nr:nucleoside-diphosphate sugar epimerase/dehydratase [Aurantiacibacter aquimixticola]